MTMAPTFSTPALQASLPADGTVAHKSSSSSGSRQVAGVAGLRMRTSRAGGKGVVAAALQTTFGLRTEVPLQLRSECGLVTLPSTLDLKAVAHRQTKSPSMSRIRASNADGPLRRPSAPAPSIATSPAPPSPPTSNPSPSPTPPQLSSPPAGPSKVAPTKSTAVSIEYQRQRAKELQEYFLDKKYEEQVRADRIFGWTRKNEIANGRWTMFGIAVGLLTEYATGANFVEQLKIIVSNLGIADLD